MIKDNTPKTYSVSVNVNTEDDGPKFYVNMPMGTVYPSDADSPLVAAGEALMWFTKREVTADHKTREISYDGFTTYFTFKF